MLLKNQVYQVYQVCTFPQAQQLRELGVEQTSMMIWRNCEQGPVCYIRISQFGGCAAFTVAELGLMLPVGYHSIQQLDTNYDGKVWQGYDDELNWCPGHIRYVTEAECRAAMLIHILETDRITVKEINQRLQG